MPQLKKGGPTTKCFPGDREERAWKKHFWGINRRELGADLPGDDSRTRVYKWDGINNEIYWWRAIEGMKFLVKDIY